MKISQDNALGSTRNNSDNIDTEKVPLDSDTCLLDQSILEYFDYSNKQDAPLQSYITSLIHQFYSNTSLNTSNNEEHSDTNTYSINSSPRIPLTPINVTDYFSRIEQSVLHSTKTSSHSMVGHMTSRIPFFHSHIAQLLTCLNQNMVKIETSASFTLMEQETLLQMHNLFYNQNNNNNINEDISRVTSRNEVDIDAEAKLKITLDDCRMANHSPTINPKIKELCIKNNFCAGVVCSGGTVANLTALWTARNNAFKPIDISKVGLVKAMHIKGVKRCCVIGSSMMHYSFRKAMDILGFGEDNLVYIPTNAAYQIDHLALEISVIKLIEEGVFIIALVGIAGTTETGSVDDLLQLHLLAAKYKIHFHVDGAWGGPLIFSSTHKHLLNGIEMADTITIDGHKQLYTPQGLGLLLFKNTGLAAETIKKTSDYIIRADSLDQGRFTLEGSRPANILYLHAGLQMIGFKGFDALLTRSCQLVKKLHTFMTTHHQKEIQPLHAPMTNILLYRYIPSIMDRNHDESMLDEFVLEIQGKLSLIGLEFVSRTKVMFNGKSTGAFRIVVSNPLTCECDLESLITHQITLGKEIEDRRYNECHLNGENG